MTHMTKQERKERTWKEIRESMLDAALSIAAREGWKGVTIRKIADDIGYSPPIVYEHFKNKEALLDTLVDRGFELLNVEFRKVRSLYADPKELLYNLSLVFWDFAYGRPELYQLMFSLERVVMHENAEAHLHMMLDVMTELNGNEPGEKVEALLMNWGCLIHGAIALMMKLPLPPTLQHMQPKQLFEGFVKRFVMTL